MIPTAWKECFCSIKQITSLHLTLLTLSQVRSTSHKPDEIYGMIERLSPGTRKIELFGRPHNVQPNWYYILILYRPTNCSYFTCTDWPVLYFSLLFPFQGHSWKSAWWHSPLGSWSRGSLQEALPRWRHLQTQEHAVTTSLVDTGLEMFAVIIYRQFFVFFYTKELIF